MITDANTDPKNYANMEEVSAYNRKISDLMHEIAPNLSEVLPQGHSMGRFQALVTIYLHQNPNLMNCNLRTLKHAILYAASLGLELGSPLNHASMMSFKSKRGGLPTVQLIIEYRGLTLLCYRSGKVLALSARAVFENDKFKYQYGSEKYIYHNPTNTDKGSLVAAYAIAYLKGNQIDFEVIDGHAAAQAIKDSPSASRPDSLWNKRPSAMWVKTAIRKLSGRLPQCAEDNTILKTYDSISRNDKNDGSIISPKMEASEDYHNYLTAIENAPDLHQEALHILNIKTPRTTSDCRHITFLMRHLYKVKSKVNN